MLKNETSAAEVRAVMDDFRRLVQMLRLSARQSEMRTGLSGAQLFVLGQLKEAKALSINDLAARAHTHQSSVSVVARRLCAKGLARAKRGTVDRRRMELELSPAGRTLLRRAPPAAQERLIGALYHMPASERRQLGALLRNLAQRAGAAQEAPWFFFEHPPRARRKSGVHG